ncbi:unnamed protein product, partial [Ectocarpus sp. 8 AP-2014]
RLSGRGPRKSSCSTTFTTITSTTSTTSLCSKAPATGLGTALTRGLLVEEVLGIRLPVTGRSWCGGGLALAEASIEVASRRCGGTPVGERVHVCVDSSSVTGGGGNSVRSRSPVVDAMRSLVKPG